MPKCMICSNDQVKILFSYTYSSQESNVFECLEEALTYGRPDIFNSDQGSQFTSIKFTQKLLDTKIRINMDGRGRVFDNIFIERLWRTVKYGNIYINEYQTVTDVRQGLKPYFNLYNTERLHQSLEYQTPWEVYSGLKFSAPVQKISHLNFP